MVGNERPYRLDTPADVRPDGIEATDAVRSIVRQIADARERAKIVIIHCRGSLRLIIRLLFKISSVREIRHPWACAPGSME
ncbi:hypothetical protein CAI21_19585 [Alkalilimnicola ehrlichii]|uniref:Uncharacterized protein n=1 Tax=Alkalilimnicola ehrlichii TaxID=351052 RepID=A0A3E0WJX1_9GAMM|nr:hypothetical protein CAI21_19585 [Alkalilimnicola ehrlichii]RFA32431.1 hypothetical protein CAL65_19795 [Alkalilimnicola ehrlichii]